MFAIDTRTTDVRTRCSADTRMPRNFMDVPIPRSHPNRNLPEIVLKSLSPQLHNTEEACHLHLKLRQPRAIQKLGVRSVFTV